MSGGALPGDRRTPAWEAPTRERAGSRTTVRARARVPADYAFFDGHFPGYPVLAGAVQLHEFVLPCLRAARGGEPELAGLSGLKFPARIRPGDTVEVVVAWDDGADDVAFELRVGGTLCSHGRLTLRPADAGA